MSNQPSTEPSGHSRVEGDATWALGVAESAVGQAIGSESMQKEGDEAAEEGSEEVEKAKQEAYAHAQGDNVAGKLKSGYGMLTGNQKMQQQGNQQAQLGEIKKAAYDPDGPAAQLPEDKDLLLQRAQGKAESLQGMIQGDQNKQTQGNLKDAQGEAWDTAGRLRDTVASAVGYDAKQGESAGKS